MLVAAGIVVGIVFVWIITLGIILGSTSLEQLKANWGEEQCSLAGLFFAGMVKPEGDARTPSQFANDNFKFCAGQKAAKHLNTMFAPLLGVFDKQMSAADTLGDVMDAFRKTLTTMKEKFEGMVGKFMNKFQRIGFMTSRVFQQLMMAMKKAAGIALATLFAGLSLQTTIYNWIDFLLKIIMIVLWILTVMAIIFFLPILPVMFLVFMAVNGIEDALPGRTGALGSIFCFASGTPVYHESGISIPIEVLKVGNKLAGGAEVEAVIEFQGSTAPLYSLRGVRVSGDHRIWSEHCHKWVLVKEHPEAIQLYTAPDRLWTLITSNREIPVAANGGTLRFADWEELPDSRVAATLWEHIVREILPTISTLVPDEAPVLDSQIKVKKFQGGWVSIDNIQIGDWIMGDKRWTHVLGICRRKAASGIGQAGSRFTDGVWIKEASGRWTHSRKLPDSKSWIGHHLVTDSGDFRILLGGVQHVVRDFTEVGWSSLDATYTRVANAMPPPLSTSGKKEDRPIEESK